MSNDDYIHDHFRLNQPLTLSEKVLYSHADDPKNQVNQNTYDQDAYVYSTDYCL
jgi:hypothetical protein